MALSKVQKRLAKEKRRARTGGRVKVKARGVKFAKRPTRSLSSLGRKKMRGPGTGNLAAVEGIWSSGKAAADYNACLSDPFNAPYNSGIPINQTGLPTFKTTRFYRQVVTTAATSALSGISDGGLKPASGAHFLKVGFEVDSSGLTKFQWYAGGGAGGGTFADACESQTVPGARIVAGSMRITRMGRADDRGMQVGVDRLNFDGMESFPTFTNQDFVQVNYFPKCNSDVEFKQPITGGATNYTSKLYVSLVPVLNAVTTFAIDYCLILESNYDTPPANKYDVGDYRVTMQGRTLNADSGVFPNNLGYIASIAAKGNWVPSDPSHFDPAGKNYEGRKFVGVKGKAAGDPSMLTQTSNFMTNRPYTTGMGMAALAAMVAGGL